MNVTFTRTGERRYRVSVEGPGVVPAVMDPAPGYDPLLPHDMAHFVVENELGLMGVFGQLAAGGNAHTFRPVERPRNSRAAKRGTRILADGRKDAELSERVIFVAQRTWMDGPFDDVPDYRDVSDTTIERICREFDRVSAEWSRLKVGESMTLVWTAKKQKRSRK